MVEPNAFHAEILPGFVKYFKDSGYNVIVLMKYLKIRGDVFSRFEEKPEQYFLSTWGMRTFLRSRTRSKYEYVLITSAVAYLDECSFSGRYTKFLGLSPDSLKNIHMIEHSFSPEDHNKVHQIREDL